VRKLSLGLISLGGEGLCGECMTAEGQRGQRGVHFQPTTSSVSHLEELLCPSANLAGLPRVELRMGADDEASWE